jgi:hypothetical protein
MSRSQMWIVQLPLRTIWSQGQDALLPRRGCKEIAIPSEGIVDKEVADAIAELKAQGIPVKVDPSGPQADLYIATAPNGEKYELNAAGLLDLKAKAKLHLEGLQELHFAKKEIPNFHNPRGS